MAHLTVLINRPISVVMITMGMNELNVSNFAAAVTIRLHRSCQQLITKQ
jgi:hypothetical protein